MNLSRITPSVCLALATVVLAGCTTSYQTIDLDAKTKGYHIFCGGQPYASNQDCLDRASDICGEDGYSILKQNDPTYVHSQSIWGLTTRDITVMCTTPVADQK